MIFENSIVCFCVVFFYLHFYSKRPNNSHFSFFFLVSFASTGLFRWCNCICCHNNSTAYSQIISKRIISTAGRFSYKLYPLGANLFELGGEIIIRYGNVYRCGGTYITLYNAWCRWWGRPTTSKTKPTTS